MGRNGSIISTGNSTCRRNFIDLKRIGFPMDWFSNAGKYFAPKLRDVEMDLKTDFDAASTKK